MRTTSRVGLLVLLVATGFFALLATHMFFRGATCVPGPIELAADVGLIDGPDAGVRVSFSVSNTGRAGTVTVTTRLSTSEGMFERRQELLLAAGDQRRLSYFFHEPTINVDLPGTQAQVICR